MAWNKNGIELRYIEPGQDFKFEIHFGLLIASISTSVTEMTNTILMAQVVKHLPSA